MNGFNSLKYLQHFNAHTFYQKKEKENKKEENIQFTTFCNTFNISKPFGLAQGK